MHWLRTTGLRLALAIGLSFSLWIFVSFSENPYQSTIFNGLQAEVRGLSPGLVVVDNKGLQETSLPPVNITVEADAQTLARHVQSSDIHTFVDMHDKGPGEYMVPVVAETNRSDLSGLSFSAITPSSLSIRVEQLVTHTVPLQVKAEGNLPFSFEAGKPQISFAEQAIDSAAVVGPQSRVVQVSSVQAVANIEQLRADYAASVTLRPLNEHGLTVEGVTVQPEAVRVRVPIRSVAGLRRVAVLGKIAGFPADGYVVSTVISDPQLVNLTGSSGPLDAVNQIETEPIDVTGATTTLTREVALLIPIGTSLQVGESSKVTVTVQIAPLIQPFRVALPVPVVPTGVGNGLLVTVNPQIVTLSVVGSSGALGRLSGSTVQVTVNLTGRGPGTYALTPEVTQLPNNVRVAGVIPQVAVTLRAPPTVSVPPTPTSEPATPAPDATVSTPSVPIASVTEGPTIVPSSSTATPVPAAPTPTSIPAVSTTEVPASTATATPAPQTSGTTALPPAPTAGTFATAETSVAPTSTNPKQ